jgi:hypothetical protein
MSRDERSPVRLRRAGRRSSWATALSLLTLVLMWSTTLGAGASTSKDHKSAAPCSSLAPGPSGGTAEGEPLAISATSKEGCIQLSVRGASATSISISELLPGASTPIANLPTQSGDASLLNGVPWRCDRLTRTFQATETLPDGSEQSASTSVTTPSCATRLRASLPPTRLHLGYPATVELTDRWGLGGLRVRACLGSIRKCPVATLKPGQGITLLRLRASSAGHPLLQVSDPYQTIRLKLRVLPSRPVLLATGDSEMQVLDDDLASDLSGSGGARVISDARQSTAISSPFFFDWPRHAVGQVGGDRPDIVAMFLGGNEGFRLGSAECCDARWSHEYANRVAGMMRVYRQDGAASVYWFLIPTPSKEPFVRVMKAVNRGIISAAARFPQGVHVFDLRPVFSPGGRYINSLTLDGRTITVHEADGFHLSESADPFVARMFIERLRHDGVLP